MFFNEAIMSMCAETVVCDGVNRQVNIRALDGKYELFSHFQMGGCLVSRPETGETLLAGDTVTEINTLGELLGFTSTCYEARPVTVERKSVKGTGDNLGWLTPDSPISTYAVKSEEGTETLDKLDSVETVTFTFPYNDFLQEWDFVTYSSTKFRVKAVYENRWNKVAVCVKSKDTRVDAVINRVGKGARTFDTTKMEYVTVPVQYNVTLTPVFASEAQHTSLNSFIEFKVLKEHIGFTLTPSDTISINGVKHTIDNIRYDYNDLAYYVRCKDGSLFK